MITFFDYNIIWNWKPTTDYEGLYTYIYMQHAHYGSICIYI